MKKEKDARQLPQHLLRPAASALLQGMATPQQIASVFSISQPSVYQLRKILTANNMTSEKLEAMSDEELKQLFYPDKHMIGKTRDDNVFIPDFAEYAKKHVENGIKIKAVYAAYCKEARENNQNVFARSYFYERIKPYVDELRQHEPDYYIKQHYVWGAEIQADFSGMKVPLLLPEGVVDCWMLIIVWPKSSWIYGAFVRQQSTAESCRVFDSMFRQLGVRPLVVKVDNAKCFVTRHQHSDAVINKEFEHFMRAYGVFVNPAPYYSPRSKSAAESSVNYCQQVADGHRDEFIQEKRTIAGHSAHLQALIEQEINNGPLRGSNSSTREYLFREFELPAAHQLPQKLPEFGEIRDDVRVSRAGVVKVNNHEYSVPYLYAGLHVDLKITADTVEIFYHNKQIAIHSRNDGIGCTILEEHKSPKQLQIELKNRIFNNAQDIIKAAGELNQELARFCQLKLRRGDGPNDRRCCTCVISGYMKAENKELYARACSEILNYSPSTWTSYQINSCYKDLYAGQQSRGKSSSDGGVFSSSDVWLQNKSRSDEPENNKE